MDRLRLEQYSYVSVHAPSNWDTLTEAEGIEFLAVFAAKNWPIVLHPDCIENYGAWRVFGSLLLIENMDKRKLVGRTAAELETVFDQLPEAGLCFDIGHAHQVDPTMAEAFHILRQFGRRVTQVHMSHVDSRNAHVGLRWASIQAFQKVAHLIPENIPIILETPVAEGGIDTEMEMAREALTVPTSDLVVAR